MFFIGVGISPGACCDFVLFKFISPIGLLLVLFDVVG